MKKRSHRKGFTLVEIMIVVAIIALLAAVAIPNVLRGRTSANESAAIGNMRALLSSLEMYRSVNNQYPDTGSTWLAEMYGANCNAGTAPDPDFGPPSFCVAMDGAAGSTIQGYAYTFAGDATGDTYTILATPATLGSTGTRSFFVNQSGVVRHCTGTGTAAGMVASNSIDAAAAACP